MVTCLLRSICTIVNNDNSNYAIAKNVEVVYRTVFRLSIAHKYHNMRNTKKKSECKRIEQFRAITTAIKSYGHLVKFINEIQCMQSHS